MRRMAVGTAAVGRPRKLPCQLPLTSVPRSFRGNCSGPSWVAMVGTTELPRTEPRHVLWQLPRTSVIIAAYRKIALTMTADGRGWPWKMQWTDVRGNCRGNCRGLRQTPVVIAALPWQWPRMAVEIATTVYAETAAAIAADFRGLPWLVRPSLPRTLPRHVPWSQPWHLPYRCHEPWHMRYPRISTVAHGNTHGSPRKFRDHCRRPPPKS